MRKVKLFLFCSFLLSIFLLAPLFCRAMPPGTLLYRTSGQGKMYGYSSDSLIRTEKGIIRDIYPGHVAVYIGQENGEDYIIEAAEGGIVKTPARYFVNLAEGEEFLGAKIPKDSTDLERAKAVAIAKSLVGKNLGYDFDFKVQKGPDSGEWTCVGLTEKIYESSDIPNPYNLGALEYDSGYYAVDITPDGFDDDSVVNKQGDCFSWDKEFSKISRRKDLLLPAPELVGYDAGLERGSKRYFFLPYTQFLQESLEEVPLDITISSRFDGREIRGAVPVFGLILRWSLVNNIWSSITSVGRKIKEVASSIFSGDQGGTLTLEEGSDKSNTVAKKTSKTSQKKSSTKKSSEKNTSQPKVKVNKVKEKKAEKDNSNSSGLEESEEKDIFGGQDKKKKESGEKEQKTTNPKTKPIKASSTPPIVKTNPAPVTPPPVNPPQNTSSSSNSQGGGGNGSGGTGGGNSGTGDDSSGEDDNSTTTPAETPPVKLNRVYATGNDDWLELYNPSDQAVDLASGGYRLEKTKTAEDPALIMRIGNAADGTYPGGTSLPAHGTYLIVRDNAKDYYKSQADAIAIRDEFGWTGDGYTIYLGTDAISSTADPDIIDVVGFGSSTTYYLGAGPAPTIDDYYILTRSGYSDDNQADYHLVPTDDPDAVFDDDNGTSTPPEDPGLFSPPDPLQSESLKHLWHFDECYGSSTSDSAIASSTSPSELIFSDAAWSVGKWGCGHQINYNSQSIAEFSQAIDSANFSVSFRYKRAGTFPRLTLKLFSTSSSMTWSVEEGLNSFYGFPGVWGHYLFPCPFYDEKWHQAVLVINQAQLYWSIYIDGEERFHQPFADFMPLISSLLLTTDNSPAFIDELAIWDRALEQSEISAINNFDAPFWPVVAREAQQHPVHKHFWRFEEGSGDAQDEIGGFIMNIPVGAWAYLGQSGHGVNSLGNLGANFPSINSRDFSFSFWYSFRDNLSVIDSRARVALGDENGEQTSLTVSPARVSYSFNGRSGILSQYPDNLLPMDNSWHQVVMTYDSFRYVLRLYVDGEEAASSSEIWLPDGVRPSRIFINNENGTVGFDNVHIWQGTLSAGKVEELYNSEK